MMNESVDRIGFALYPFPPSCLPAHPALPALPAPSCPSPPPARRQSDPTTVRWSSSAAARVGPEILTRFFDPPAARDAPLVVIPTAARRRSIILTTGRA